MIEDFKISIRLGRAYLKGYSHRGRKLYGYEEIYKTSFGELPVAEWKEKLLKEIEVCGETKQLAIIKEHCKKHCAWLHSDEDVLVYSLEILAGRTYLCGNDCWKEVDEKIRKINKIPQVGHCRRKK